MKTKVEAKIDGDIKNRFVGYSKFSGRSIEDCLLEAINIVQSLHTFEELEITDEISSLNGVKRIIKFEIDPYKWESYKIYMKENGTLRDDALNIAMLSFIRHYDSKLRSVL